MKFTPIIFKIVSFTKYLKKTWIIFAACESGKFGNKCSVNYHCVNQTCDPINGACPDGGCQRGYKRTTCRAAT